ncbi:pectate lyase PelI [Dickeya zeae]|uniref:pectate lyase PelI n=1 Tax=Dickeya zeae TaxID=204042 RepID=UPI0002EBF5AF|nr:pectate lyase PelI [Dickeya zeae]AJC67145.1 pectate lyase [Dickeya zeae EC1]
MFKYVLPLCALALAAPSLATQTTLMLSQKSDVNYLGWSTDASKVVRQEVYRGTTSNPDLRERIAVLDAETRTFNDADTNSGVSYWYWVDVVSDNQNQAVSNAVTTAPSTGPLRAAKASSECKPGVTFENRTVNCGGVTIGTSCPNDSDKQKPLIILKNATVKNLRISASGGADGIHCDSGDCTIENVIWEDICEDAATNNGKTLTIVGGIAHNVNGGYGGKPDKVLQHNSKNSTTVVKGNFTLTGEHGKLWRSCGDCSNNGGPRFLTVTSATVNGTIDSIAGVNRNYGDVATISGLKIKNYKEGKPPVCEEFKGVVKGQGSTEKYGEKWDTANCKVSRSGVSKL